MQSDQFINNFNFFSFMYLFSVQSFMHKVFGINTNAPSKTNINDHAVLVNSICITQICIKVFDGMNADKLLPTFQSVPESFLLRYSLHVPCLLPV